MTLNDVTTSFSRISNVFFGAPTAPVCEFAKGDFVTFTVPSGDVIEGKVIRIDTVGDDLWAWVEYVMDLQLPYRHNVVATSCMPVEFYQVVQS